MGRGPEVRSEEGVGLGEGVVDGHGQVTSGTRVTSGRGVDILNTSHVQQLLRDERGHNTGTTRGGDEAGADGTALARDLARHSVRLASVETPVTSADRDQVHLGVDDTTADGSSDFLGSLHAETDVAISVTDSDVALEASALAGSGLLLHRHDLHDLVSQGRAKEVVNNLVLLDGDGEEEDLLHGADLALLHEATQLGDRNPFLLLALLTATTAATTATLAVTTSNRHHTKKTIRTCRAEINETGGF